MEFITAEEACQKWGVSLRQVQRLLAAGRIPRAQKYGRAWMIPRGAEKPCDPRREKKPARSALADDLAQLVAATTVPMPPDGPDAILGTVTGRRVQLQYEAELAYLRGDFRRVARCFEETPGDNASRLRACPTAVAAAISAGDYRAYTEIEGFLKRFAGANESRRVAAFAELALATAAVSAIAPNLAPSWLIRGDFGDLPAEARPDALYLRAKYFLSVHNLEAMLNVAQTALTLCASESGVTLPDIYLRVSCAVACYGLERASDARRWLLEAMRIALPHGFITPFAEVVSALGGLVEQCLAQEFPERYGAVLSQWERTWGNWIDFHNQFTKDNISMMLTLREHHIALLVANRVPYAKIARQHGISVGRLKNIMLGVYAKLMVSGRDELPKYIL